MPPPMIRRPVTITVWLVLSTAGLSLSPLLLALAALASRLSGRPQPLIFARLLVSYLALELGTLIGCGLLWVASGAGHWMRTERFTRLHYRLLRWFVNSFAQRWAQQLQIEVSAGDENDATRALAGERPVLLFSRHAGPGDTVMLIDQLLTRYQRHPSVVFKQSVAIDPCVDLIGHRLPHAVLDPDDAQGCEDRIQEVSARLGRHGVLLLFPEGGNFTADRRRRAIDKLTVKGRRREAARAHEMAHVLPPRPTGALAALRGNPAADVIFAAHTGLGLAAFPKEIWRAAPLQRTLRTQMWLVSALDRPTEPDEQADWIYDWWKRIDDWVHEQGQEP